MAKKAKKKVEPKVPTEKEVAEEIEVLRKIKPTVRKTSLFGDNHHHAINAQIEVLENDMPEDEIYDHQEGEEIYAEEEEWRDNVVSAALDARRWLDGEEREEPGPPSESWKPLIQNQTSNQ